MSSQMVRTRHWTRQEYEALVAAGIFHPEERLELLGGDMICMPPQGSAHATAVQLIENALRQAFGANYCVRVQLPLAVDAASEPEPDVAVVPGTPRDYRQTHPDQAVLIVEVSDSSLSYDRERKARRYAQAGMPEYWILNLIEQCLEIYRMPTTPGAEEPHYQHIRVASQEETVSPLGAPEAVFAVSELLP